MASTLRKGLDRTVTVVRQLNAVVGPIRTLWWLLLTFAGLLLVLSLYETVVLALAIPALLLGLWGMAQTWQEGRRNRAPGLTEPEPELRFHFDPSETGRTYGLPPDGRAKYFSVEVQSTATVHNCEGLLMRVEAADDSGEFSEVPHFDNPQRLVWHNRDATPMTIEPDVPRRLNLVCTESPSPERIILTVESHEQRGVPTWFPPGRYRLTVRARGDEAPPVYARFEVEARADWETLTVSRVSDPP